MDWISFFWGVGALLFVNIVYGIWVYPKQLKQIVASSAELENRVSKLSELEETLVSLQKESEKDITSLDKRSDEAMLTLERVKSSLKLRKTCPVCNHEFPLYFVEEKVNG